MKKLINKLLFKWYSKEIVYFIAAFYDNLDKERVVDSGMLNTHCSALGWSGDKMRRVHYLCEYFGLVEQCKHPLFNKRLAYRLRKDFIESNNNSII